LLRRAPDVASSNGRGLILKEVDSNSVLRPEAVAPLFVGTGGNRDTSNSAASSPPEISAPIPGVQRSGLFGTYRFFLANLVVLSHLWLSPLGNPGGPAVFAFFVLSGFLMTKSLRQNYLQRPWGAFHYLANRALRLYPTYWLVVALGIVALLIVPNNSASINGSAMFPTSWEAWATNILIIGISNFDGTPFPGYNQQFVSQIFSVHIEIIYYVLMIVLVRWRALVCVWVVLSMAYAVVVLMLLSGFTEQIKWGYMSYLSGTAAFSLGSLVYFVTEQAPHFVRRIPRSLKAGFCIAYALGFIYPGPNLMSYSMHTYYIQGTYLSLFLSVPLTLYLASIDRGSLSRRWRKFDDFLGNISYPVFICHYIVAVLVTWAVPDVVWRGQFDARFYFSVLPWIYVVSALLYYSVEKPMEKIRDMMRGGALRGV